MKFLNRLLLSVAVEDRSNIFDFQLSTLSNFVDCECKPLTLNDTTGKSDDRDGHGTWPKWEVTHSGNMFWRIFTVINTFIVCEVYYKSIVILFFLVISHWNHTIARFIGFLSSSGFKKIVIVVIWRTKLMERNPISLEKIRFNNLQWWNSTS